MIIVLEAWGMTHFGMSLFWKLKDKIIHFAADLANSLFRIDVKDI